MSTLNRYAVPTPPETDGESVTLCDECHEAHPQATVLEWLESQPFYAECEGVNGAECPNEAQDEATNEA
jgi:hypothetical protein